jgi:hypothetical protein
MQEKTRLFGKTLSVTCEQVETKRQTMINRRSDKGRNHASWYSTMTSPGWSGRELVNPCFRGGCNVHSSVSLALSLVREFTKFVLSSPLTSAATGRDLDVQLSNITTDKLSLQRVAYYTPRRASQQLIARLLKLTLLKRRYAKLQGMRLGTGSIST